MLAAVVAVMITAGCGKSSLDGNKLEGQIKRRIKAGGVELPKLACPSGRKVKKGDRFQCKGEAANGVAITVAVVQTSDGGSVSWNVTGGLLDVPSIEDAIQRQARDAGEVTVDCQSPDLVAVRDGDSLTCQSTTVGEPKQSTTYKVTANSNATNGEGFDISTA
jgi:uncharacterized protein DUF4333